MPALPDNPLLIGPYQSLTHFVHTWAKQYDGELPRVWLRLQRQLHPQLESISEDATAVHEWMQAWAAELAMRDKRHYYCILNITQAFDHHCSTFEHQDERVMLGRHIFYDQLPCAFEAWKQEISSWCMHSETFCQNLHETFSEKNPATHNNFTHPAWAAAFAGLEVNHTTLLHQTFPDEDFANVVVCEGWWLLTRLHGQQVAQALQTCTDFPWDAYRSITVPTSCDLTNMDDLIF